MTVRCRCWHFLQFIEIKHVLLVNGLPHPYVVGVGKPDFSVKFWRFCAIPNKIIILPHCPSPYLCGGRASWSHILKGIHQGPRAFCTNPMYTPFQWELKLHPHAKPSYRNGYMQPLCKCHFCGGSHAAQYNPNSEGVVHNPHATPFQRGLYINLVETLFDSELRTAPVQLLIYHSCNTRALIQNKLNFMNPLSFYTKAKIRIENFTGFFSFFIQETICSKSIAEIFSISVIFHLCVTI